MRVVKRGQKGVLVSSGAGIKAVAAAKAEVVDTVGARDAFTAGFLAGYLRGFEPLQCAAPGYTVAGLSVRAEGPLAGTADRSLLRKAIEAYEGTRV